MALTSHPLLCALRRNPAGAILIALQIGITLAILVNAAAIVTRAIQKMSRSTGLDTRDTFVMTMVSLSKHINVYSTSSADLAYLRHLPGVAAASVVFGAPLTDNGSNLTVGRSPSGQGPTITSAFLPVNQQGLRALDVPLIAGRNFRASEIRVPSAAHPNPRIGEVIVTQALAHALFAHQSALGKTIYVGSHTPATIIGITRNFMGPQLGQPAYNTVLAPEIVTQYDMYDLLVRTQPGKRATILREAKRHIGAADPNALIGYTVTFAHAKRLMYSGLRNLAIFLSFLTVVMLALCCLGIFGLGTFNVATRTRQIGIRRALGARRRDIVALFLAENALVVSAGAIFGCLLALAIGQWLTDHDGVARLDPWYLLIGIAVLALTSQLAAWQPARRAARIPPSVATRTV